MGQHVNHMEEKASSFKKRANLTEKHNDELHVEIENTRRKRLQVLEHRQLKIAEIAEVKTIGAFGAVRPRRSPN